MTTLKKYIPHGTSIIWRISLREKFPFLELFWLFWSVIPAFGLNTNRYGEIFSSNPGKCGPE